MSIRYIVGNPGSGKTYYAVYEIYTNSSKYENVYTNINGFDFDAFNNVKLFDFQIIKRDLEYLYNLYQIRNDNNIDNELIEYCKKRGYYKSLFVIDEVHNVFTQKDDKVITWWLTYHRHMFMEFILITQDLSLVHNEYKRIGEFFYRAVDGQKRLFQNKLKYIQYSNYRMYANSIIKGGGLVLKKNDVIYKIYHSGEFKKQSSFVVKYLIIASFLIVLVCVFFYFFISNISKNEEEQKDKNVKKEVMIKEEKSFNLKDFDLLDTKKVITDVKEEKKEFAYFISCLNFICDVGENYELIPSEYINFIFKEEKPQIYTYKDLYKNQSKYLAIFKNDVFAKFLKQKESLHEKNTYGDFDTKLPFSK